MVIYIFELHQQRSSALEEQCVQSHGTWGDLEDHSFLSAPMLVSLASLEPLLPCFERILNGFRFQLVPS